MITEKFETEYERGSRDNFETYIAHSRSLASIRDITSLSPSLKRWILMEEAFDKRFLFQELFYRAHTYSLRYDVYDWCAIVTHSHTN